MTYGDSPPCAPHLWIIARIAHITHMLFYIYNTAHLAAAAHSPLAVITSTLTQKTKDAPRRDCSLARASVCACLRHSLTSAHINLKRGDSAQSTHHYTTHATSVCNKYICVDDKNINIWCGLTKQKSAVWFIMRDMK